MQVTSHADHVGHDHDHDQGHDHDHGAPSLWFLIPGVVLLLASLLARWLYPDNPMAAELSVAVGAIFLAIPIFKTAIEDIMHGHMHMDELIALGVLAAMAHQDWYSAGIISFFMLIAHYIESKTAHGAHEAIESLVRLSPGKALRIEKGGAEVEVPSHELVVGDRVRIRPGDVIPADGKIDQGQTTINEATITGESLPRDKRAGEDVYAGTENLTGAFEMLVSKVGEDTTLGRVRDLILAAEKTKLPIMKVIDRYAGYYTPVVLMIAAIVWFFTDDWNRVISLLIMSCPCALILATPTAMVAALSAAARQGVLFKNVVDLEAASRINAIVFDKTGTLTTGVLGVEHLSPVDGVPPSDLLQAAVSVEQHSKHPAAQALLRLAAEAGVKPGTAEEFHEEAGQGVSAKLDGQEVLTGRLSWLAARGIQFDDPEGTEGLSVIAVSRDGKFLGWIGLRDQIRDTAKQTIDELKALKIKRIAMITGDRESVAARVITEIGGGDYRAEVLPQEKAAFVAQVQAEGYNVSFIGDGVNDAPALAASDTGIAMGAAGSDVAIHSAKVALMSNDLLRVPFIIRLSRTSKSVIFQNLIIGGVFISIGWILIGLGYMNGVLAAILHNVGSLIIIFNSARLVRFGEEVGGEEDELPVLPHTKPSALPETS